MFALAASMLRGHLVPCAITAVYSPGQAILASAVGADWIIPQVNRAKRLIQEGATLVARLAQSYAGEAEHPRILAASVKSDEEAIDALSQGADAVSVPIDVLTSLAEHELSRSAIAGFVEDAATLLSTGDDEG